MDFNTIEVFLKIILACFLGGIIGLERESVNRPAGFRTHILVIVGSTIVMITNIELISILSDSATVSPGRFGAAVISGIGFLGAGTIIKEGSSVKGLTTAASLWATACIGLAIGSGLYAVSISATIFVYLTLEVFPKLEKSISKRKGFYSILISSRNEIGQLSKITNTFKNFKIKIIGVKTISDDDVLDSENIELLFKLRCPMQMNENALVSNLSELKGVSEVIINP